MPADPLADVRSLILRHWGFRDLRPLQEQAIRAALDRRDSVVVMPTGGGKSLCYQAPAALRADETAVVISPLISLMKDQVDHLTAAGVSALRIDSTLDDDDKRHAHRELRAGRVRLLFVSPERMMLGPFQTFLKDLGVRTFAIDEAHCISHWGHDFRPEYRQLASIRQVFPDASFHAFTATATGQVRQDIIDQLHLRDPAVLVGNFDRPNLTYRVIQRHKMLDQVLEVLDRHKGQAGIIYCISRKDVDSLTARLVDLGFNAKRYRAANQDESSDFNARERSQTHDAFRSGACDLVVATVAFGMGIDRSDIRFVLHTGMPKSIEHYQQEAGRAGRDGLEAECLLLHSLRDVMMWKDITRKSVEERRIDAQQGAHAEEQAEQINAYAKAARCRHKVLVEHFGQGFEPANCGACDICLGEVEFEPDSTVVAQKILSCVARVQERFGMNHVIDVLRGSRNEKVEKFGHEQLSTFGIMQTYSAKQVRDWASQLLQLGLLDQSEDGYHTIKLNDDSWQVLRGRQVVRLTRAGVATASRKSRSEEVSWEGVNSHVFDALRDWRRAAAAAKGMPPYTIFSDSTLRDISRVRPSTADRLRAVSGIGDVKLKDFGADVLRIVADVCRANELTMDNARTGVAPIRPRSSPSASEEYFPHFQAGKSVAEVAALMGKAESTVREHLCAYILAERPDGIEAWVPRDTAARIASAARTHGTQRLKPVFLALGEQVPYDAIAITFAYLNSRSDGEVAG